jgi:hypothetical protein
MTIYASYYIESLWDSRLLASWVLPTFCPYGTGLIKSKVVMMLIAIYHFMQINESRRDYILVIQQNTLRSIHADAM